MLKTCPICNAEFENNKNNSKIYCSLKCKRRARHKKGGLIKNPQIIRFEDWVNCPSCGKTLKLTDLTKNPCEKCGAEMFKIRITDEKNEEWSCSSCGFAITKERQ